MAPSVLANAFEVSSQGQSYPWPNIPGMRALSHLSLPPSATAAAGKPPCGSNAETSPRNFAWANLHMFPTTRQKPKKKKENRVSKSDFRGPTRHRANNVTSARSQNPRLSPFASETNIEGCDLASAYNVMYCTLYKFHMSQKVGCMLREGPSRRQRQAFEIWMVWLDPIISRPLKTTAQATATKPKKESPL